MYLETASYSDLKKMNRLKAQFQQYIKHLKVKTSTQVLKKKQQTFYILLLRTILSLMEIRE